jgi:WD40 repeat protein
MSHIFISYSRKDIEIAQKIVDALSVSDLNTWIDWKSIPKGEDWEQEIYRGIEKADAFLFLISPDSVVSRPCNNEIAHALRNGKRILPIFIGNANHGGIYAITDKFLDDENRKEIGRRNFILCREGIDDFDGAITEIQETIHTDYEWLKYHTDLQVKALSWDPHKDDSRLLRGKELREAEEKLARAGSQIDPQPTELQRNYLLSSQRHEVRQRRQITLGLGFGLIIVAVLAIFAWNQRNNALSSEATAIAETNAKATALVNEENARATAQAEQERAEEQARIALSRQLIAQIPEILDKGNWELAILLAIEAGHANESADSIAVLRQAISHPGRTKLIINNVQQPKWNFDGSRILTVSFPDELAIAVWNAHTGKRVFSIEGFTHKVLSALWSPTGTHILTVTEDGWAKIWNAENGTEITAAKFEFLSTIAPAQVSWSPDGTRIVAIGCSKVNDSGLICLQQSAKVWNIATNDKPFVLFTSATLIDSIRWNSLGDQIITNGLYEHLEDIWDASSGSHLSTSSTTSGGPGHIMDSLLTNSDKNLHLVTKCYLSDYTQAPGNCSIGGIEVREVGTEARLTALSDGIAGMYGELSPNQNQVLTLSVTRVARVWDLEPTKEIPVDFDKEQFSQVALNRDQTRILTVSADYQVAKIWNVHTGQLIMTLPYSGSLYRAEWSPDGDEILTTGYDENRRSQTQLWDASSGQLIFDIPNNDHAYWNPQQNYLLTQNDHYEVQVWDTRNGDELFSLPAQYQAEWNADGSHVLTISSDHMKAQIWDSNTGVEQFTVHSASRISEVAESLDQGKILLIMHDGSIQVWDEKKRKEIFTLPPDFSTTFITSQWNPDGKRILVAKQNRIQVWNTETSSCILDLTPDYNRIDGAEWNPTGDHILIRQTVRSIGKVKLLDAQTGAETGSLSSLINVRDVFWEPHGRHIMTIVGNDGWMWNAQTGKALFLLPAVGWPVWSADWTANGNRLITASANGLQQWYTRIQDLVSAACLQTPRNLTYAEWNQYIGESSPYQATCPNLPIPAE